MPGVLSVKGRATRAAALLLLAAALLNLSLVATRAATTAAKHAGEITLANGVNVDGSPALRGQTLFSGSRLATAGKTNVTDVVEAVSSAEVTLQAVTAVRDRVVNAYQEILRMPI